MWAEVRVPLRRQLDLHGRVRAFSHPTEQYDDVAADDDEDEDDSARDRGNMNGGLSDDSLLQHPLSVCVSRAVSSNDLYRAESLNFECPVCAMDDNSPAQPSPPAISEDINEDIVDKQPLTMKSNA